MKQFLISILFVLLFCELCFAQSSPVKILEQPQPELPKGTGTLDAQGTINLRVQFLENGQIGEILVISGIPVRFLTENAVEAAKRIKFQPAIKDGKPVTVSSIVIYGYSWKGFWEVPQIVQTLKSDEKAEAVLKKAVQYLGGENYLNVKTQIGRGKFSEMREGKIFSFKTFVDILVFPGRERTEFKGFGEKNIQTNVGDTGWLFDGVTGTINVQGESQIEGYKRGINASLDNLLRGNWRNKAVLNYVGKRQATLGTRNDVVKLIFDNDFAVEFEFSADGAPFNSIYKRANSEGSDGKEEDRYAQFIEIQGIKTPFIVDHFTDGIQTSRVNYETIEFNKPVSDTIFTKPNNPKEAKKDLKL